MTDSGLSPATVLAGVPKSLRDELVERYNEVVENYRVHRWEPSELNGGKFCEVVHSILRGYVDGSYPAHATKPKNMVAACQSLERADQALFPRSVRIQIPRVLIALYEIRNNRGVGHVGGDVDSNHMDATFILSACRWILAELIRVFHQVSLPEATAAVEALTTREFEVVWAVAGKYRVLDTTLTMKEKTLLLLHASARPLTAKELVSWVEHSNPSIYRRDVLKPAHKAKLIEFDEEAGVVHLSPKGVDEAEDLLKRMPR